jgi:HD-GYP domain-containing protein (c-di-GMP phosphodiesterase class II)
MTEQPSTPPPAPVLTSVGSLPDAARLRELAAPLLSALEAHNSAAHAHSQASATYAEAAALGLGLTPDHAAAVRELARVHEIGQILIPREVLAMPSNRLGDEHLRMYAERFERAGEIVRSAGLGEAAAALIEAVARRPDTEPAGPEAIPVESRIIAGACACDTILVSAVAEPGSETDHLDAAVGRLDELSGSALDPGVVGVLGNALRG